MKPISWNSALATLLSMLILAWQPPVGAAWVTQDDPAAQCERGVQLYLEGRYAEAMPLLEAGFVGRDGARFAYRNDLGKCALALGAVRYVRSDYVGALEAYNVALPIFQSNRNRQFEASTLNNIGLVHEHQGYYDRALTAYEQALTIEREVGARSLEAATLDNIGNVYQHQGRPAEALDYHEQALTIARAVNDRPREGATLNNIGLVYQHQGRVAEALEVFQQALAILREVHDRVGESATLDNIGTLHGRQGLYVEALEIHHQALLIRQETGDRAGEGNTLGNIATVYDDQGRYAEALEYYQQALNILREVGDRAGEGSVLNNVGTVYESQGRYAEALNAYEQALEIRRDVGDRAGEGATLHGMAGVLISQGRFGEALEICLQALMISRQVGRRSGTAAVLNAIGIIYLEQGRDVEALNYYQQALDMCREIGDRNCEGTELNNIGLVHHDQGDYDRALATYEQALAIRREIGDRSGEGLTLSNIGEIYRGLRRFTEALEAYQSALAIARAIGDRPAVGLALSKTGVTLSNLGRYGEALETYKQALALLRDMGDRLGEFIVLHNIGYSYEEQGQPDQALAYSEQAIQALEGLRATAGSEISRSAFVGQYTDLYDRIVRLRHQQGQDTEAFHTSERGRARAFLDSLATGYVELSDNAAADLLEREQETYAARQAAQASLARARGAQPFDPTLVADLEAQLAAAEKEHAAALAAIQARGDQLAALVPGRSGVLELPELQALLDEQTTLISYYVLGDKGSLAFVITANGMQTIDLPEATPQNLRTAVDDLTTWQSLENPYPLPLQNLYRWLVAPLADRLKTPRVAFVPHSVLHYVPFTALTDGERYLGEQFELSVLPSASSLRFIQQNAAEPDGTSALIFGNPTSDVPDLKPLAYAEQEASDAASLLGVSASLHQEATEARLRADVTGAKVVHLSAHGGYNTANPLYSTIYLAPGDEQDGRLETHEVYSLDLKGNEIVVLSACETNVGELSAGDEVVGLTRAFFFAGAPTVISSLWSVDDAATGTLMTAFYRHWLQDGLSKAQALQAAQADVHSDSRWASPFYWAGFVLNGDPREAQPRSALPTPQSESPHEESGTRLRFVILGGVGVAIATILAIWLMRRQRAQ